MKPDTSPRAIMRAAQHLQTLLSVSDYQSCSDFSLSLFDDELGLLIEDSEIQASESWVEKKSLDSLSNMAEALEGESDYYKVDPEFMGADLSKENKPVVIVDESCKETQSDTPFVDTVGAPMSQADYEKYKLEKLTDELKKHEDFWHNKKDDSYGINLSVSIAINAVRQAVLSAIVEDAEA